MKGNLLNCTLTPKEKDYNYKTTVQDLENKYGFTEIGEGGFGVVLGTENCVIKLIKDVTRCNELTKEREIYERIQKVPLEILNSFFAKFPKYHLYNELHDFCHFNMQKIFSPLSGFGDLWDDEDYGHGFVVAQKSEENGKVLLVQDGKKKLLRNDEVYVIDKPGNLIHFYINHFDVNLKEKLDNNQGILIGRKVLENMFTSDVIKIYTEAIGELLAFLIFDLWVIPTDIEVVLGTQSKENRLIVPFIYDFNECDFYKELNENTLFRIAKSMYNKNGRFYFPNDKNPYYSYFRKGFLKHSKNPTKENVRERVLEIYSSFFQ